MRSPGLAKKTEKCGQKCDRNAVLLEWCMPPETPMFVKMYVDLLTPLLHQCEDYAPAQHAKRGREVSPCYYGSVTCGPHNHGGCYQPGFDAEGSTKGLLVVNLYSKYSEFCGEVKNG